MLTDATVTGVFDSVADVFAALDDLERRQRTWPPDARNELFVVDEERRQVRRGGEN